MCPLFIEVSSFQGVQAPLYLVHSPFPHRLTEHEIEHVLVGRGGRDGGGRGGGALLVPAKKPLQSLGVV